MAEAGGIRAGKAYVELSLNDKFTRQLDVAAKKLKSFGDTIAKIGAGTLAIGSAITAPLLVAAQRFASVGSAINDMSARTGVGAAALQELIYAAEQTGASAEDVEAGIRKMSKAIFEAATGSDTAQRSLASIGLTVEDLKGLKPDEQFAKIAKGIDGISDPSAKAAVSMELLGKGGTSLIPMMAELSQNVAKFKSLGLGIPEKDIQSADRFGDTLDDIKKQSDRVVIGVGAIVAEALQPFAEAATRVLRTIIDWIGRNRNLVLTVLGVGAALVAAGGAMVGLGLSIRAVGFALSGITSTFKLIGVAVALLTNPVILVGAALVALAGYFLYASDTGQAAVGYLLGKFNELKATVDETVGGIADALAAGDIMLAAKILWTGLQLAWTQGTQQLQQKWSGFRAAFVQVAAAAFFGALEIWQNVKASLMTAWENTTSFLSGLWDGFIGTFTDLWNGAVNIVTKGLNVIKGLWDDTFDSDAANKAADQLLDQQKQARAKLEQDNAGKREDERKNSVGQIETDRQKAVKDINDREQAISAAADQNASKEVADLEQQRADLQKQLDALRQGAKDKRTTAEAESLANPKKPGQSLDDVAKQRVSVQPAAIGVFNARALQSLRGGGADAAAVKTEKNTAEIAKGVKELVKKKAVYSA